MLFQNHKIIGFSDIYIVSLFGFRMKSLKSKPNVNNSPLINIKCKENVRPVISNNNKVSVIKKPAEVKVPIVKDCKIDLIPCECSAVDIENKNEDESVAMKENENEKPVNISDYKSPLCSSNQ